MPLGIDNMLTVSNMSAVLESYCYSKKISDEERKVLERCWLESLNTLHYNRFPSIAPAEVCDEACVSRGNYWIICNAAILDRLRPIDIGLNRSDQIFMVLRHAGIIDAA